MLPRGGQPVSDDRASWQTTSLEVLREADFSGTRLNRAGTYVVCFGAEWCPITRRFIPRFQSIQGRIRGTLAIADITSLESTLWETFHIRITPSILAFRDGETIARLDGKRFLGVSGSALARLEVALSGPSPTPRAD